MKKVKGSVLADGEVTGHAHRLSEGVDVYETEDMTRLFTLVAPDTVRHEEHKPVSLPAGDYASGIVEEFDHLEQEIRRVQD